MTSENPLHGNASFYECCSNSKSGKCRDCKFNSRHSAGTTSHTEGIDEFEEMYQHFLGRLNYILVQIELFSSSTFETKWSISDVITLAKNISKDELEEACYSCMTADSSVFACATGMTSKIEKLFEQGFKNLTEIESVLSMITYELKLLKDAGEIVKTQKKNMK